MRGAGTLKQRLKTEPSHIRGLALVLFYTHEHRELFYQRGLERGEIFRRSMSERRYIQFWRDSRRCTGQFKQGPGPIPRK